MARKDRSIDVHSLYSFLLYSVREQLFSFDGKDDLIVLLLLFSIYPSYLALTLCSTSPVAASLEFISFPITIRTNEEDLIFFFLKLNNGEVTEEEVTCLMMRTAATGISF